ncbi:TRAP transporter small permease subunit [Afifella pfennigii]|uniref:TRAP transporter small permease subunit n=1 Tax=Afifella pfennigii TaxID=209897 RepID=UPI00068B2F96|nr:TRAP transporter small permease subunit [Afifella pfennigii]
MRALLNVSRAIDGLLAIVGRAGAWLSVPLLVIICYDVITRYFGVPKFFGFNSTQYQESEYWLHAYLFCLVMGYAYIRQAHVRIDLVRDRLPLRGKFLVEMAGCLFALIPYSLVATYLSWGYFLQSYSSGEASKSVVGLSHIWLLKISMPIMFALLGLAGISVFIKSLAGWLGRLPPQMLRDTIGTDEDIAELVIPEEVAEAGRRA